MSVQLITSNQRKARRFTPQQNSRFSRNENNYRYISNRIEQFNYKAALEADLPIGCGEIESAHRYVIQERLKIASAWWKENNAQNILALRTLRANNNWDHYWDSLYKQAA